MGNCLCGRGGAPAGEREARDMLAPAGLEGYAVTLARAGFDRREALEALEEADFGAVEAFTGRPIPPGHRKGILQAARRYAASGSDGNGGGGGGDGRSAATREAQGGSREPRGGEPAPKSLGGGDSLRATTSPSGCSSAADGSGAPSLLAASSVMDTSSTDGALLGSPVAGGGDSPPPGWGLPSGICSPRPPPDGEGRGDGEQPGTAPRGPHPASPFGREEVRPRPNVVVPPLQLHRTRSLELEEVGGAIARRVEALRASVGSRPPGTVGAPASAAPARGAESIPLRRSVDATGAEIRERVARLREGHVKA